MLAGAADGMPAWPRPRCGKGPPREGETMTRLLSVYAIHIYCAQADDSLLTNTDQGLRTAIDTFGRPTWDAKPCFRFPHTQRKLLEKQELLTHHPDTLHTQYK